VMGVTTDIEARFAGTEGRIFKENDKKKRGSKQDGTYEKKQGNFQQKKKRSEFPEDTKGSKVFGVNGRSRDNETAIDGA